jgi:hypothetical protein
MSTDRQDQERAAMQDLDLEAEEAGRVKGGRYPIEGKDSGSSGFSMGSVKWSMRRRKNKNTSSGGSTAGGRPV